jgi:hypothetical protein
MEPSIQAEAGSIHGANDAPADGHAREWWERYIPLLIPLLLVTIYLAYIWPSYPDLMPVFLAWMVLVTAALWFVALRVIKLLKSPEYKSRALNPNVRPLRLSKRHLASSMISMGANMALLATLWGPLSWIFKGSTATNNLILFFSLASLVFTALFVILWAGTSPDAEWRLRGYPAFVAIMAAITLIATAAAFAGLELAEQVNNGPPATWPDLLRFAQHEAEKIDKGAVLESVRARPPYSADPPFSPQSTGFEVEFTFVTPDSSTIRVEVLDTDLPRLLNVEGKSDPFNPAIPPDTLDEYVEKLPYVTLSPREACRITEQEGLAFARQVAPGKPLDISMLSMSFDNDWQKCFGTPAGWTLMYSAGEWDQNKAVLLRIDGASGQIVGREYLPDVPGITPAPLASLCR